MVKHSFLQFVREQWGRPVPLVTGDLTRKVVLITGSNIGLGFEAIYPPTLSFPLMGAVVADLVRIATKEATKFDNILVGNAALAQFEFIPTPDGWEHQ